MKTSGDLVYRSKCGRFAITRRTWVAPSRSTSYVLTWRENGKTRDADCDALTEAKALAADMTDSSSGHRCEGLLS